MLSKALISYIQSLQQKKFRQKYQCFVVEGNKIGIELLTSDWDIEHIIITENFSQQNKALLQKHI